MCPVHEFSAPSRTKHRPLCGVGGRVRGDQSPSPLLGFARKTLIPKSGYWAFPFNEFIEFFQRGEATELSQCNK